MGNKGKRGNKGKLTEVKRKGGLVEGERKRREGREEGKRGVLIPPPPLNPLRLTRRSDAVLSE